MGDVREFGRRSTVFYFNIYVILSTPTQVGREDNDFWLKKKAYTVPKVGTQTDVPFVKYYVSLNYYV